MLDNSGKGESEFLSSLNSAMEDAFSRLQMKQMRQTKLGVLLLMNKCLLKKKSNEHTNSAGKVNTITVATSSV